MKLLTRVTQRRKVIEVNSVSHRLMNYAFFGHTNIKHGCNYSLLKWLVMPVVALLRISVELGYSLFICLGYYVWVTLAWLLGFKPRYWVGLTPEVRWGDETMFKVNREYKPSHYHGGHAYHTWKMPIFVIAPLVGLLSVPVFGFGLGKSQVMWFAHQQWFFIAPMAYASLLVAILFMRTVGVQLARLYVALCPETQYVNNAGVTVRNPQQLDAA